MSIRVPALVQQKPSVNGMDSRTCLNRPIEAKREFREAPAHRKGGK